MKEKSFEVNHVLIVDNNPIFRAGIRSLLNGGNTDIKIVAEADEDENIPALVRQTQPDVILLDIIIAKGQDKFDVLDEICTGEEPPNIVVMTPGSDVQLIIQSLSNGVTGVITKDVTAPELRYVVNRATQRQRALSSTIVNVLVDYLLQREIAALSHDPATVQTLTERELEVFYLIAQGLANREIAERLSLSLGTIKSHASNIMGKLQVNNRAQVALLAAGQLPQE